MSGKALLAVLCGGLLGIGILVAIRTYVYNYGERTVVGEIVHSEFVYKVGDRPATMAVLRDNKGKKHYVGIDGHDGDFAMGTIMELTYDPEDLSVYEERQEVVTNTDGSKTVIVRETRYWAVKMYRIISRPNNPN